MSGSASLTLEQGILQHTLGIAAMAFPTRVYVALCVASLPPSEGVGGVEAFGGSYARVAATFALLTSPSNTAANTQSVEFPLATAAWGELGYFEIWTAQTGGSRLYWGGLVDPVSGAPTTLDVSAGDIVRFSAGTLAIEVTAPTVTAASGVSSFNTRTGAVILSNSDVVAVLPPSANPPLPNGVAAAGTSAMWARGDHVHPGATSNVLSYGADPTGVADSTGAFRAAIATGRAVYLPTGSYLLTDMVTVGYGQLMYGDSRVASQIVVSSASFNLAALGIVRFAPGETAVCLRDIGITCYQPDTSVRANIVHFPPAIYAQDTARFQINRVRLSAVNIGLDARGNAGGAFINDFEVGALTTGMLWGGAYDVVHINGYHFWPFGLGGYPGLNAIYSDTTTKAMIAGRVDGFVSKGFFSFLGNVVIDCSADPNTGCFEFDDITLDGGPGAVLYLVSAYRVLVDDFIPAALGAGTHPTLVQTGGSLIIKTVHCLTDSTVPTWQISGGYLSVAGGYFQTTRLDTTAIAVSGTAFVNLSGISFSPAGGLHTQPYITQTGAGAAIRLDNCDFEASAQGVALQINTSYWRHYVGIGVIWNNMTYSVASSAPSSLPGTLSVDGHVKLKAGLDFNSNLPASGHPYDLSAGIDFFGGVYGICTTTNRVNIVSASNVVLMSGPNDILTASPVGIACNGHIGMSTQGAIVAAGTTQGTATVLTAPISNVSTVAAGSGVIITNAAQTGSRWVVLNHGANALQVYVPAGHSIYGDGVSQSLAVNGQLIMLYFGGGTWFVEA